MNSRDGKLHTDRGAGLDMCREAGICVRRHGGTRIRRWTQPEKCMWIL
jgi:hypothetical protein